MVKIARFYTAIAAIISVFSFGCKKSEKVIYANTFFTIYPYPTGDSDLVSMGNLVSADGSVYNWGYIFNPGSSSTITYSAYLLKTDAHGNKLWGKTLAGNIGTPVKAIFTTDGQILIAPSKFLLAKYDTAGNLIWENHIPAYGFPLVPNADGGCTTLGYVGHNGVNPCIVNAQGVLQQKDSIGLTTYDFSSALSDAGGNFYITGETNLSTCIGCSHDDPLLMKISPGLNLLWQVSDGDSSATHAAVDLCIDNNQDVYITGTYGTLSSENTFNGLPQSLGSIFVVKYDSAGNMLARKVYTEISGNFEVRQMLKVSDGIVIAGTSNISNIHADLKAYGQVFLLKIDDNLNVVWQRNYPSAYTAEGTGVSQAADGGFYISATVKSFNKNFNFALIKTDAMGNL